jgi:hypothetical protein
MSVEQQRNGRPYHPFATLGSPIDLAIPYLPKGAKGQGTMLNHGVGRRVSVSQEDQFQRNGVTLGQRSRPRAACRRAQAHRASQASGARP